MGSITSLLLRTLFNVSVAIQNVVIKYVTAEAVATMTCHSIEMNTASDNWQADLKVSQRTAQTHRPFKTRLLHRTIWDGTFLLLMGTWGY